MWLGKLQIAIIERDTDKLDKLLDATPTFNNTDEIKSAMYLLREAAELLYELKDETAQTMSQLKKNMDFLRSTDVATPTRLDIKS